MQKYSDTVLDRNGNVVVGATVTVTTYPAGTSATVYGADTPGANVNPLTTDANGYFEFWAPNGNYSLAISKTGITTRTVSNILIQDVVVSVTEYGAKGDGSTDDLAAIQAAHDAVYNAGGGTVTFPPGTFMVSGSILFRDNVHFVGAGRGATTVKLVNSSSLGSAHGIFMPYSSGGFPAIGYWCKNNSISHLSINGNKANNAGTYEGIALYQVKDCIVFNCEAYNCRECGFQGQVSNSGTDQHSHIAFIGCVSHDNLADGFQVGGVIVSNCLAYSNGAGGVVSVGNFSGSTANNVETVIIGCRAENNTGSGIGALWQLGPHIHTIISGCSSRFNGGYGISAIMDYTTISNCVAEYNTLSGMYAQGNYISINGGFARNNTQNGIAVPFAPTYLSIRNVTCTDSQAVKTQGYGISIGQPGSGSNNAISGCTLTGNLTGAIQNGDTATDFQFDANQGYSYPELSYTPTVSAAAGTFTSVSAAGRYKVLAGNMYFVRIVITVTTNGTAATAVRVTLPITIGASPTYTSFSGRELGVAGRALACTAAASNNILEIVRYDGTYPAADGAILVVEGFVS